MVHWKALFSPRKQSTGHHIHPSVASLGDYLWVADETLGIISVFDDLRYDRADADILSPAMRRHAIEKLTAIGFHQNSGNTLKQASTGIRCIMPKAYTLGASPFDITRYMAKHQRDFYLLTPTQTACQFITHYASDEAVDRIKGLLIKQPVNLEKLADNLEQNKTHQTFKPALIELRQLQATAVASEPLSRLKPLGAFGSAAQ